MENFYFYLIIAIIAGSFLLEFLLDVLNQKRWVKTLPNELKEFYDEEKYAKAQAYNKERNRLSRISSVVNTILLLAFLIAGGFGWLHEVLLKVTEHLIWHAILYFAVLGVVGDIINLPFSLYGTFVIEEKYGFNKTNLQTFFTDKIKGYALAAIIGGGLMYLVLWFILETGGNFWLYAWGIFILFILIANYFYSSVIVPLFNKLKPLEDSELRRKIEAYSEKVNFPLQNIYVMDSSKRSTKGNAYFSGMGKKKKVVLFDTLIEKHTDEELVAIFAHEVGHYKKNHIAMGIIMGILQSGLMLFIFSRFVFSEDLSAALGADEWSLPVNVVAFGVIYEPISLVLGVLTNYLSRKNEYEADAYARKTYSGKALAKALKQLSTDHFANLRPHPGYVFFHYSHPPLLKRLAALRN